MLDFVLELLLGGIHAADVRDDDRPEATRPPRWLKWLLFLIAAGAVAMFALNGGAGWLGPWL